MTDFRLALERFLARLMLRSTLGAPERSAVLQLPAREVQKAAHRDIVRPGEIIHDATLVVEGVAGRFDQLANGHRQITALHIPGDMCDLHSVVAPHAGWGIESLSPSRTAMIPHEALRRLAVEFPRLGFAFWRDTVADGSVLAKWLSALGRRDAKARLAHLLCEMGIRFELCGLGHRDRFPLPLTQSQLADVLGVTAVHLNRSLQWLRNEGLVVFGEGGVEVLDGAALRQVAEFDPEYLLLERQDRPEIV